MFVPAYGSGSRAVEALATAESVVDKLGIEWTTYKRWSEFLDGLSRASAVVVAIQPGDLEIRERLGTLPRASRSKIIVLSSPDAGKPTIDGIQTISATRAGLSLELPWALYRVRASAFFREQAARVDQDPRLTAVMRRFIEVALLAEPPLVTVEALAQLSRRSAQDVWYHVLRRWPAVRKNCFSGSCSFAPYLVVHVVPRGSARQRASGLAARESVGPRARWWT